MTKTPREQRKLKPPNKSLPTRSEWIVMGLIVVGIIAAIIIGRHYG